MLAISQAIMNTYHALRAIVAIIDCEIRLQLRALTLWLVLIICCGAMGLECWILALPADVSHEGGIIAITASPFIENFVLLLLPFLFMNTFARDRQRKMYEVIWVRPVTPLEYALGKGLAATIISAALPLLIATCGWAIVSIIWHALLPIAPWFSLYPLFAMSNVLVALLTLFTISLMPVPLIGVLLSVGVITYFTLFRLKTMLVLPNLTAVNIFYSASVGFGPDAVLFQGQLLCILLTAVLCMGLYLLVFQIRKKNGIIYLRHWVSVVALLILSGGLLLPTIYGFQSSAATFDDLGPIPAEPLVCDVSHYQLALTANPDTGDIEGSASFILTPGNNSGKELYLALSSGLHIEQIRVVTAHDNLASANGTPLSFQSAIGWTKISLAATSYGQGLPVQLSISYAGQLTTNRSYYAKAAAGFLEPAPSDSGEENELLSYFGQGVGFLKGVSGYWYPLLWTTQTVNRDGGRPIIDEVHLRFPTGVQVFTVLPVLKQRTEGQWQELIIQPHGRLPLAFVAALSSSQQISFSDGVIFYHGLAPDQNNIRYYYAMMQQAETLDQWLGSSTTNTSHWRTVIVPLLQEPLVAPGLLLVPEQLNVWEKVASSSQANIAVSFLAGENVARAWWLTTIMSTAQIFTVPKGVDQQRSHSHTILALGNDWLYTMLSDYSAAFTTERIFGQSFLEQKQSLCQQRRNGGHNWTDKQRQQADKLGIKSVYCTFTLLDYLELHDGVDTVTKLLQQFIIHYGQEPVTLDMFLAEASTVLGRNLTIEAKPYICVDLDANNPSCSLSD